RHARDAEFHRLPRPGLRQSGRRRAPALRFRRARQIHPPGAGADRRAEAVPVPMGRSRPSRAQPEGDDARRADEPRHADVSWEYRALVSEEVVVVLRHSRLLLLTTKVGTPGTY